jgi:hypothetical protein
MDQVVPVIGQNPFCILKTLHIHRVLPASFQLQANFLGDGLDLFGIAPAADDEEIGEGSNTAQV